MISKGTEDWHLMLDAVEHAAEDCMLRAQRLRMYYRMLKMPYGKDVFMWEAKADKFKILLGTYDDHSRPKSVAYRLGTVSAAELVKMEDNDPRLGPKSNDDFI